MPVLPPRPQEQLLIDQAADLPGERLLCNTAGRAQFAAAWGARHPSSRVACYFLDLHLRDQAAAQTDLANVDFVCQADPPLDAVDLFAWCVALHGDAELTREMLQAGHQRLRLGGKFVAATDNPRDQWLHEELRKLFAKVTREPHETGMVYRATKVADLKKLKNFACEFAFRDGERLIHLRTRPGVFSHRELDGGARALIETLEIRAGERILDLGCGSGAVGIAAGLRAAETHIVAVDSNPRAIENATWAAQRNGATNFEARLNADGSALEREAFDLVLANPPYYSNFRLAEVFVTIAAQALRPGGRLVVVTKQPEWYLQALPALGFVAPSEQPQRAYWVLSASKAPR